MKGRPQSGGSSSPDTVFSEPDRKSRRKLPSQSSSHTSTNRRLIQDDVDNDDDQDRGDEDHDDDDDDDDDDTNTSSENLVSQVLWNIFWFFLGVFTNVF